MFVRSRQKADEKATDDHAKQTLKDAAPVSPVRQEILGEIHEKIVGNLDTSNVEKFSEIVLGDIVEKKFDAPMLNDNMDIEENIGFPTIKLTTLEVSRNTFINWLNFCNTHFYEFLEISKSWQKYICIWWFM